MKLFREYPYSLQELIKYGGIGGGGSFLVLCLFYHSLPVSLFGAVMGAFGFLFYHQKNLLEKQRWKLMIEFKDVMDSLVSALVAGYSMENAVTEAYKDLSLMYPEETPMLRELAEIRQKLSLKQPLDSLFFDLGRKTGIEDMITFAQIYGTARKSGGNLVKVMKRTADNIGEKMEVQDSIQTMFAGKKMEAVCMMMIPLFILVYLTIFTPGFLDPLYQGFLGHLIMTAVLLIYIVAVVWSFSIMKIEC